MNRPLNTGGKSVNRSLSIVLPVRNVEKTLADSLQLVFEVLSDLTEQFEVLVVDEGSTDHTAEVAHELAVQYPQLRVACRSNEDAELAGNESELGLATGDIVFVQQRHAPFSPTHLRRLWEMCEGGTALRGGELSRGRHTGKITRCDRPMEIRRSGRDVAELGGIRVVRRAAAG
jgi:glycosyltransferase involved in cell wall biosynthesis